MKKTIICIICLVLILFCSYTNAFVKAKSTSIVEIYDENGIHLTSRQEVEVGDDFLNYDGLFEIIELDKVNRKAIAKKIEDIALPKVQKTQTVQISNVEQSKTIGLYSSHNDESYIFGDGTSSIYGNGGINDVRNQLETELKKLDIQVINTDTLHLPHDSGAYSRSGNTAKRLLNQNLSAIFDIHRDAGARSTYVVNIDGKDKCKVRMVVGKANPNYQTNLEFALYLFDVAKQISPNLFLDIYMAKGSYNQDLFSKAILFEMGTEQVEKTLAMESTKELAKVINTTLYKTSVEDDGSLNISPLDKSNSINIMLSENQILEQPKEQDLTIIFVIIFACIGAYVFYLSRTEKHSF